MTPPQHPIRLVVTDVDGTLTDGVVHLGLGDAETKSFSTKDGAAFGLLRRAGIEIAIVSGRHSLVTARRAAELGVTRVQQPVKDKVAVLRELAQALDLPLAATAFFGDDLTDLPAMVAAGFSVAPADAAPEVREHAALTTNARGGHGAFREGVEAILKRDGVWEGLIEGLLHEARGEAHA